MQTYCVILRREYARRRSGHPFRSTGNSCCSIGRSGEIFSRGRQRRAGAPRSSIVSLLIFARNSRDERFFLPKPPVHAGFCRGVCRRVNCDAVVRTNIFTGRHKGTKKDTLKIFKILFVLSVASCETGLFTRSSIVKQLVSQIPWGHIIRTRITHYYPGDRSPSSVAAGSFNAKI